jgi:hypothetical protein
LGVKVYDDVGAIRKAFREKARDVHPGNEIELALLCVRRSQPVGAFRQTHSKHDYPQDVDAIDIQYILSI